MKKRCIWLLCLLCLCLFLSVPAFAAGSAPLLVDNADCLTDSEEENVQSQLSEVSARWDMDVVVLTVPRLDGRSAEAYADDYYDYNGYGEDGVLLLVAVESRDWAISTTGYGIKAVTDYGLEYMAKRITPFLSNGSYETAFTNFAAICDRFIGQAKDGKPYDVPKKKMDLGGLVCILMCGLFGAWRVTARMKEKLCSVQSQSAADYVLQGSMNVTHRGKEIFLHSVVTHTSKSEKKSESSGGSTTHTSSSGQTHGGSSGKF